MKPRSFSEDREVDLEARNMAQRAISMIEQHAAVCVEGEKRWNDRMDMLEETLTSWLGRIQIAYETGQTDISQRHSNAINSLANNWQTKVTEQDKAIAAVEKKQNGLVIKFLMWGVGTTTTMAGIEALFILTQIFQHWKGP